MASSSPGASLIIVTEVSTVQALMVTVQGQNIAILPPEVYTCNASIAMIILAYAVLASRSEQ